MLRAILAAALLALQLRTPEALRPRATPPPEGTGKFREFSYTFKQEPHDYVIEFTPPLPGKRPVILDAMKSVCHDLYDLDFTKGEVRPAPGEGVWMFERTDLRTCYGRQMPNPDRSGGVKTLRVWMP